LYLRSKVNQGIPILLKEVITVAGTD